MRTRGAIRMCFGVRGWSFSLFFERGYVVAQKVDDAGLARCPGRPLEQGKQARRLCE